MHKEVTVDRPEEAAAADGVGRPPRGSSDSRWSRSTTQSTDWNARVQQRVSSLRIFPALDRPVNCSKELIDRPVDQDMCYEFPNMILGSFLIRI